MKRLRCEFEAKQPVESNNIKKSKEEITLEMV